MSDRFVPKADIAQRSTTGLFNHLVGAAAFVTEMKHERGSVGGRAKQHDGGKPMSKKAAEHHKKASEHLTHAARHHGEAAKHHEAGLHEKAAHHAHTARAHVIHARGHAEEAVKAHAEEHGKK
jgi:hypothetical protein